MNAPRLHILISLLMLCCLRASHAQELPVAALEVTEANPADTQLRINKTTLLENKTDKNRIDAATLLLFSDTPAAREILLDVLRRTDNPGARAAVCEALNPTRTWQKLLKNKEDFIKPLLGIITSEQDFNLAKLAAEATLNFGYGQVQQELEKAVTDPSLPLHARTNAVYALKRHPDKQAVAKLIALVDSPEVQVADAAKSALASIGISIGPDIETRKQTIAELQQRGTETFLRERLVRQETRMRELETELSTWQGRWRAALGSLFDSLTDEAAKNAFLAQHLAAQETTIRVWALDKLEEQRRGTVKLKLSEQLQTVLLGLISDPSRQVRSKTARLLWLMRELNAAKPLLEQLKVEQDDLVRRELLLALGEGCYFASLPTSGYAVPEEIRKETLEWALRFLGETDAEKARSGAEVLGKLLEQNGLKPEEVDRYLNAMVEKYGKAESDAGQNLRGYLLGAMGSLCSARSTCRVQAAKLFGGLFERALGDSLEAVRLAAVDGLINIDKTSALRQLRKNMLADPSVAIRAKLIDLAGETGASQDLDWLVERIGAAGEGDAWQAMLKIFRRSGAPILADWMRRIETPALTSKISVEQKIAFLTLVEQKAMNEEDVSLLKDVQQTLVRLYISGDNPKAAAEYLKGLLSTATNEKEKQRLQSQLLTVYLGSSSIDLACELVGNCLVEKNLGADSLVVKAIEEHLQNPNSVDQRALLEALEQIKVKDPVVAEKWRILVRGWTERFAKAKKAEGAESISN